MNEGAEKPESSGKDLSAERFEEVFACMLHRQRELVNNMTVTEHASRWNYGVLRMERYVKEIHRGTNAMEYELEKNGWILGVKQRHGDPGRPFGWLGRLWEKSGSPHSKTERRRQTSVRVKSAHDFGAWLGANSGYVFGRYLRFSFSFMRFLSESGYCEERHVALIKANLRRPEPGLLFYNCLSDVGRKFEQYAIEFELFDNMSEDDLIDPSHARLIDPRVFGPDKNGLLTS